MLSNLSVKRPVSTIMILLMIVVVGFASIIGMPQALMPDIDYPYALVMFTYPGAGPEEVESLVTEPVEQALASTNNMKNMISMSFENMAIVMLEFGIDTDMNFATLDMREKVSLIQDYLPDDVGSPTIMKANMDSMPIMQIYVSGDMDLQSLYDHIENNVASAFEKIDGVASVSINGAISDEISVEFNQEKMTGYGIAMSTVSQMLSAENISLPSGDVTVGSKEFIVRTNGEFQSVEEIKMLPITVADGSIIHLQDVATVETRTEEKVSETRIDNNQSIGIFLTKASDGNLVGISDDSLKVIEALHEKYPEINMTVGFDQADFVRKSISSVEQSALSGALLAIIVIFLFLRNLRSTLVIAISIPSSILATFIIMNVLDMSLNLLTLGSLTLAVGMLVDNSVVVLENIFRKNKLGLNAHDAAVEGSSEVGLAVSASTLTSVVVYLPIALSGGLAGMMFKDFSYTIIAALMVSLVIALTVVPMLCSKMLDNTVSEDYIRIGKKFYKYKIIIKFTQFIDALREAYGNAMYFVLKRRKRTIAAFLAVFIVSITLIGAVGMELIPESDEGSFSVTVSVPYGTSFAEQNELISDIETYIAEIPELEHITVSIGSLGGMISTGTNGSSISVILCDKNERSRSTEEVMKEVKEHFKNVAGAEITYALTSSMSMSMGGTDMSLDLTGTNLDLLRSTAEDVASKLTALDGVVSAEADTEEGNPEVKVTLNRTNASFYGITAYQVANTLSNALSGTTATELKIAGDETDINLSLPKEYGSSIENLKQIVITAPTGAKVPVGQIANFEYDNSPVQIYRMNQQNQVSIAIDIDGSLTEVQQRILDYVNDEYLLDEGITVGTSGMTEEMMDSFADLAKALVVAILLVYLVMAAQFESIILPLMVMMSIPFAMTGAFLALFLTGYKLSMPAFIGLIMLVGIVVNNAILLIEFINQNKEEMGLLDAIVEAGKVRLRPILMTSLTTVMGMVPMSLAIGEGAEVTAPMGISIIGGMIASTFVTLLIIPVLYDIVEETEDKMRIRRSWKKDRNAILEKIWLRKQNEKEAEKQKKRTEKLQRKASAEANKSGSGEDQIIGNSGTSDSGEFDWNRASGSSDDGGIDN